MGRIPRRWCGVCASPAQSDQGQPRRRGRRDLSVEDFNADARAAIEWTRARLNEEARAYLAALPEMLVPDGFDFTLAHGSPRDPIWEYLTDTRAARENLSAFATTLLPRRAHPRPAGPASEAHPHGGPGRERGGPPPTRRAARDPQSRQRRPAPRRRPGASYMLVDTAAGFATWSGSGTTSRPRRRRCLEAGLPPRLARRLSFGA